MKKAYVKPQVYFEDFQLSASIAAGCTKTTNLTQDVCGVKFGPMTIFLDSIAACDEIVTDGEDGYCYHNPDDYNRLFTSM